MELCVLVILCRYPVFGLSWAYVVSGSDLSIYLIYLYFLSSCLGCPVFFSSVGCFFNGPSKYHLSGLEVEYHGVGKSYWLSSVSRLSVNVSTLLPLHRYNTRTQIQRAHTHTGRYQDGVNSLLYAGFYPVLVYLSNLFKYFTLLAADGPSAL